MPPRSTTRSVVAALALLVPAAAPAQETPPPAAAAAPLALDSLAGRRLAEGRWTYSATVTRGDATIELGRRTLTVSAVAEGGRPAWLLLDETRSRGQELRDSLVVRRDDLRPIRQHAEVGPLRVRIGFGGDSIVGDIAVPGAESAPVVLAGGPGVVVNAAMLESALTLLPLGEGWSASVRQLAVSPVGTALVPLTLRVVDVDTVTVPAGTFATWVVEVAASEVAQHLWVDRATGRLILARNPAPGVPDVVYQTVLIAAQGSGEPREAGEAREAGAVPRSTPAPRRPPR